MYFRNKERECVPEPWTKVIASPVHVQIEKLHTYNMFMTRRAKYCTAIIFDSVQIRQVRSRTTRSLYRKENLKLYLLQGDITREEKRST